MGMSVSCGIQRAGTPAFFLFVPWHRNVNRVVGIIPFQGNAAVQATGPIFGEIISFLDTCNKMLHIFSVDIFYFELVHHQHDGNRLRFVCP
jgi:hypothetical protein